MPVPSLPATIPVATEAFKFEWVPVSLLKPNPINARKHSRPQKRAIARSIKEFGFTSPLIIDGNMSVLAGNGRLEAAMLLGLEKVPCIRASRLTPLMARAYALADNKLSDRSSWNEPILAAELKVLSNLLDLDIEVTGFEQPEIDLLIQSLDDTDPDAADDFEVSDQPPVSKLGDLWALGKHRLCCGSALNASSYAYLQGVQAAAVFTDPPYNVKISGHVRGKGKRRHKEFVMASGELTSPEFQTFLTNSLQHCAANSAPGALIYACMDFRHMREMLVAGENNALPLINLCVWVKTNGAMGSMYRSRHELVFLFKNGDAPHTNNVQLGRFGRNRTNVWNYAGANGFGRRNSVDEFDSHPTVKPVRLVQDALLDCTQLGDLVLDPFLGSGTTMLAAERTGRRCFGIELDPIHVDTSIRRWEAMTGLKAVNEKGLTYEQASAAPPPVLD